MISPVKAGDFSGLAQDYSLYRPDYCRSVLKALLGLLNLPVSQIDFADVGAGTGIWTRMVLNEGVRSVTAIEPNDDMRNNGIADSQGTSIRWLIGSAEKTGLPDASVNWISMASSFHWTDFPVATKEFHRILKSSGRFTALWNPRFIEANPLLVEIETHLKSLNPQLKRVSSGRSGITETLTEKLLESPYFEDVVYMEGRHIIKMDQERYLGAWRSVNDLRVQLGAKIFDSFLGFVEKRLCDVKVIEATYLTRAWSARKKE